MADALLAVRVRISHYRKPINYRGFVPTLELNPFSFLITHGVAFLLNDRGGLPAV
jgi:hypothetical protein